MFLSCGRDNRCCLCPMKAPNPAGIEGRCQRAPGGHTLLPGGPTATQEDQGERGLSMTFWKSISDGNRAERDLSDPLWETYTPGCPNSLLASFPVKPLPSKIPWDLSVSRALKTAIHAAICLAGESPACLSHAASWHVTTGCIQRVTRSAPPRRVIGTDSERHLGMSHRGAGGIGPGAGERPKSWGQRKQEGSRRAHQVFLLTMVTVRTTQPGWGWVWVWVGAWAACGKTPSCATTFYAPKPRVAISPEQVVPDNIPS